MRALRHERDDLVLELAEARGLLQLKSRELASAQDEIAKLRRLLDDARRAGKRQAAPFSKGPPKANPKKPGRKPGAKYGVKGTRPLPTHVDSTKEALFPEACSGCGGHVVETAVHQQFVVDTPPVKPFVTCFNVHVGECEGCGARHQGTHPDQHSDALGAARVLIGPRLLALAVYLNKEVGASYGKIAALFEVSWGVELQRSTLTRAVLRVGELARPLYERIRDLVKSSDFVVPDETGWRVGGRGAYLWAFVTENETLYVIRDSRGHEVAFDVLGADYSGGMTHDGYVVYGMFKQATHQQCNNHLLVRCREVVEATTPGAPGRVFAEKLKAAILLGFELRDRRDSGVASAETVAKELAGLERLVDVSMGLSVKGSEDARLLQNFVREHRGEVFAYLRDDRLDATNHKAEQGIRPAVVNRKMSGGNRTGPGAKAQEVLTSVARTLRQREQNPVDVFEELIRTRDPFEVARKTLGKRRRRRKRRRKGAPRRE